MRWTGSRDAYPLSATRRAERTDRPPHEPAIGRKAETRPVRWPRRCCGTEVEAARQFGGPMITARELSRSLTRTGDPSRRPRSTSLVVRALNSTAYPVFLEPHLVGIGRVGHEADERGRDAPAVRPWRADGGRLGLTRCPDERRGHAPLTSGQNGGRVARSELGRERTGGVRSDGELEDIAGDGRPGHRS